MNHGHEFALAELMLRIQTWILLFATSGFIAAAGCAQPLHLIHDQQTLNDHIIAVDGQGIPHDATDPDGKSYDLRSFRGQLAHMFNAMDHFHAGSTRRKILIFVHGGLNAPLQALTAADNEIDPIMAAGYYPIFLNWNSDFLATYGEHVTKITQGETDDGTIRALLSPLYIFADVGRALTRAPIVWSNQIGSDIAAASADVQALPKGKEPVKGGSTTQNADAQRWAHERRGDAIVTTYENLKSLQQADKNRRGPDSRRGEMRIYIGPDLDVNARHLAELEASYILTSPSKFGLSWIIDGLGTPAWQDMSRRTLMAFDGELGGNPSNPQFASFAQIPREKRAEKSGNFTTTGALEELREELHSVIRDQITENDPTTRPRPYEVTLIGHSMGTMILNEWIRRELLESKPSFYANIVYMAAACSVRDFGRAVIPYLVEHRPDPRASDSTRLAGTQFYSLMLHPLADLREREALDLPPRGSLLVWLDDFLADPQTPLDRTFGRWSNIIPAVEMIPQSVRGQVSLKAFTLSPYGQNGSPPGQADYGPQAHGQFRGQPYWCPDFWYSETPTIADANCVNTTTQP